MKKFKHFIKEQSQSTSRNIETIRKCFDYFSSQVKLWQDASNDAKEAFRKDKFQKINFLQGLSPAFTIIRENPEDLVEYSKDSSNLEYAKKSMSELKSMLQDAYGSEARAVATLQYIDDVEKSLEQKPTTTATDQAPTTATSSQEIPPKIKEALDNLGLEY